MRVALSVVLTLITITGIFYFVHSPEKVSEQFIESFMLFDVEGILNTSAGELHELLAYAAPEAARANELLKDQGYRTRILELHTTKVFETLKHSRVLVRVLRQELHQGELKTFQHHYFLDLARHGVFWKVIRLDEDRVQEL